MLVMMMLACGGDRVEDVLALTGDEASGEALYGSDCSGCHGESGEGGLGPSMSEVVSGHDDAAIVEITLLGLGEDMPAHEYLSDQDVADILAWLTANFSG